MILDSLKHLRQYESLFHGVEAAAVFLENLTEQTPTGKHSIVDEKVYAMVQRYETKPEDALLWECHDRYLDIQYICSGKEKILWAELHTVPEWNSYNESNDSTVSHGQCLAVPINLEAGQLAIFAPQDAHKPKCAIDVPASVMKVVVKIAL